ncbi:RagB/SusD family nutrient uptake outer membrane protein [Chitinophaga sp. GbtcB8]|uniref:RagB/SusD family nutrient uptake outer membrane protein n=1 Tax=Chitinophaga sp. GbtcB8 TaxID=2824753 RepID=UPI001C30B95D|nr:RagB/SusD family nutrient uptake outer membrane protein [Chitinophaga sp. GbtcB8]
MQLKHIMLCISAILTVSEFSACKKWIEAEQPLTSVTDVEVYIKDENAIAVLNGLYTNMSSSSILTGSAGMAVLTGLSADEWALYTGVTDAKYIAYYTNNLVSNYTQTSDDSFWNYFYNYIFICNKTLEGLAGADKITPAIKKQLLGEARFMRAFAYFYLVNLYGEVPIVTGTDYTANAMMPRAPIAKVYEQIIIDLKEAKDLLSDTYLKADLRTTTDDRLRPTSWAATALLARVYLYIGDWKNAETQATTLINNTTLFGLPALNNAFLKNSTEAIWQLQPVIAGHNTEEAWTFIIPNTGLDATLYPVYLSDTLLHSFEPADQRLSNWVDTVTVAGILYHYPYKYKSAILNDPVTEYLIVLRLDEQYLIRSEARAQLGNISGAVADLNNIRQRAGLPGTTSDNRNALLNAIFHERQVELFTEWGHRWMDLKRSNRANELMKMVTPMKGGSWQTTDQLYPIPFADINSNNNLVQNPGY